MHFPGSSKRTPEVAVPVEVPATPVWPPYHTTLGASAVFRSRFNPENVSSDAQREAVDAVHQRILDFSDVQRQRFENFVAVGNPALYASQRKQAVRENTPWFSWLMRDCSEWQSNGNLLDVLEWHGRTMAELQYSPEVAEEIETTRIEYKDGLKSGIRCRAHSQLAEAAIEAVDSVPVFLCDPFDPDVVDGAVAYAPLAPELNYVVIAAYPETPRHGCKKTSIAEIAADLVRDNAPHEWNHKVLATSELKPADYAQEAETELLFLASGGSAMDYEYITPYARESLGMHESWVYGSERALYSLVNHGVDPLLRTRAYSGTRDEKERYSAAVDKVTGIPNTLNAVSRMVKARTETIMQEDCYIKNTNALSKAAESVRWTIMCGQFVAPEA